MGDSGVLWGLTSTDVVRFRRDWLSKDINGVWRVMLYRQKNGNLRFAAAGAPQHQDHRTALSEVRSAPAGTAHASGDGGLRAGRRAAAYENGKEQSPSNAFGSSAQWLGVRFWIPRIVIPDRAMPTQLVLILCREVSQQSYPIPVSSSIIRCVFSSSSA